MYFKRIEVKTKNFAEVYLSPMSSEPEDIKKYTEWMNNPEILHWLNREDQILTYEEEKRYIESLDHRYNFSIILGHDNYDSMMIGVCSIKPKRFNGTLGIFIDPEFQSKGIGTAVIKSLLKYGFETLNLHRIDLTQNKNNEKAHKCYKKAGLKDFGIAREAVYSNGKYEDVILMDILRSEYDEIQKE